MSTSEAQVIARALYDSLVGRALETLQAAAPKLASLNGDGAAQQISAALPSDTPREVQNLLLALANEGKLGQLSSVVAAFERFAQQTREPLSGAVTSAEELSTAQQERITADLRAKYGPGLELSFGVDPALIGGLIIRVGDQVLDNSLRTRLSAVQRNMLAS